MDASQNSADEHPVRFDLLTENPVYKPFRYPWAYDAWLTQQRVPLAARGGPAPPTTSRTGTATSRMPSATFLRRSSASSPRPMSR